MAQPEAPRNSETLQALFSAQLDGLASWLEEPAHAQFGGQANLLDADEIQDQSLELQQLIGELLDAPDPHSTDSDAYHALERYFVTLARKILARGGSIDTLVHYTQTVQRSLLQGLEALNEIEFTRSSTAFAFFSDHFIELLLAVFRTYLSQKEETIQAQESELRETATPITEIWNGVLTLPLIGTLDSERTVFIMDALLERIARDQSRVVVMDLTGVGGIDSEVSRHLIQMVRAIQLMGAEAVLTGIRPEIARTMTHLGIDLGDVTTRGNLADGLQHAFHLIGVKVVPAQGPQGGGQGTP